MGAWRSKHLSGGRNKFALVWGELHNKHLCREHGTVTLRDSLCRNRRYAFPCVIGAGVKQNIDPNGKESPGI